MRCCTCAMSPAGNSSGLAASFGVGGLGTDTGDSIRGPSSHLGLVGLRAVSPAAAGTVTAVLAVSAGNDFLHTGFALLCGRSNAEERRATALAPLTGPRRAA